MLFDRQKQLLALLKTHGGRLARTDFQKLLFLYCQEQPSPIYEFVPYRFGGFSFVSYADRRRLIDDDMLVDDEDAWLLTKKGERAANVSAATQMAMIAFSSKYKSLRGDALIAHAYRKFPYYAIRSEITDRVLKGDTIARSAITSSMPAPKGPGLCTIGYEGRTPEAYINLLICNSVTLLCDVRRNPISRKYGFSKSSLAKCCDRVGIRYEHLPELGIASEDRQHLKTEADRDALFLQYESQTLPAQADALSKIRQWIHAHHHRVALTCFERESKCCHRHCVANSLHVKNGADYKPVHL